MEMIKKANKAAEFFRSLRSLQMRRLRLALARLRRPQCRFASYRLVAYPPTAAIQLNVSRYIFP